MLGKTTSARNWKQREKSAIGTNPYIEVKGSPFSLSVAMNLANC